MNEPPVKELRVLGVDPGSRATGWGCVMVGDGLLYLGHGIIRLSSSLSLPDRLSRLYSELSKVVENFNIQEAAVETVFAGINVGSALKLGEARGVVLAALAAKGVNITEYTPTQVKATLTRYGKATKQQVREIVIHLLGLTSRPSLDASDALALALTHALNTSGGWM